MSKYRKNLDGFAWPSHLNPKIRWMARDISTTPSNGDWFGFENKPFIRGGYWYALDSSDDHWGIDLSNLVLPEGSKPLLLCRDDYVTNAEACTPDVTAMENALREISRIANAKLSPLEQDAAMEIIASKCYEVLGE